MKQKAKTVDDYFHTFQGAKFWRRGNDILFEQLTRMDVPDGKYEVELKETNYIVPRKGVPLFVLVFKTGRLEIAKQFYLGSPEAVAALLMDLRKMSVDVTTPSRFTSAIEKMIKRKPRITLQVETTIEDIQNIKILRMRESATSFSNTFTEDPIPENEAKLVRLPEKTVEVVKVQMTPEVAPEPIPEPKEEVLPTPATPEPPKPEPEVSGEVEIVKGDTIRARYRGEAIEGEVTETLDFHNKILIKTADGQELIIGGNEVIAKIA